MSYAHLHLKLEYFNKSVALVWLAPTCLADSNKKKKTLSERESLWGRLALCMGGDHGWIERPEAAMNEVLWLLHTKP